MQVIYEIPGQFRITHIPEIASGIGGRVTKLGAPFLLNYLPPGSEEMAPAEYCQLSNDVFAAFLSVEADSMPAFRALLKYAGPTLAMSEGMIQALLQAPRTLLTYVAERTYEERAPVLTWLEPEHRAAPYGVDVLACWPTQIKGKAVYEVLVAYCNPDGWFDTHNGERLSEPDYYQFIPATPAVKKGC